MPWKLDFSNIENMSPRIACRRAEFDRQKEIAKGIRQLTRRRRRIDHGGSLPSQPPPSAL